jgi:hypothetical protein
VGAKSARAGTIRPPSLLSSEFIPIRRCPGVLLLACAAALLPGLGHAQITPAQACKTHTPGVVVSMKKAVEFKRPASVAMQSAGFAPGGARHRMAELAYRMFSAGDPERHQPLDMAFRTFLSGHEPEDGLDAVKAAFIVGYRLAQRGGDKRAIARAVMDYCEALDPAARARLDPQFYAR